MIAGILLVGGKSSRMGEDKAELIYHDGQTERQRLHALLSEVCDSVYLSHRADQEFTEAGIVDPSEGPLAAIASAFAALPETALLVLACDMPLLKKEDIVELISQRDSSVLATCYKSAIDGKPEPLCAIYEPSSLSVIQNAIENGNYCPRTLLSEHAVKCIALKRPHALMNANSPAERIEVNSIIQQTRTMKTVNLKYFAQLRELANKDGERIQTESCTPAGLYEEIKQRYQFPHKQKHLMVAVNDDFSTWDYILHDNDEVVFIPPVAGG